MLMMKIWKNFEGKRKKIGKIKKKNVKNFLKHEKSQEKALKNMKTSIKLENLHENLKYILET